MELTEDIARNFARIALGHVAKEYPNKLDHVMECGADAHTPRDLHPVFFGSYDWHSCVHSWWTLLTIRRLFPDTPEAEQITALAQKTFTKEKLAAEQSYLERPASRGFERPYGWGWLLYLHLESVEQREDCSDDCVQKPWASRLEPMARIIADRFKDYLGILTYPITVGTHYNTSFALLFALEWADKYDSELAKQIRDFAQGVFGDRSDYAGWEPGGDEFLSPVLSVAMLMQRVMEPNTFEAWFAKLVLENGWLERECRPATVSDRSDGKIAHLDGLNLSRAWSLATIAKTLKNTGYKALLHARAEEHLAAAMPHVAGDYMGEHWLASFALLALLESAPTT